MYFAIAHCPAELLLLTLEPDVLLDDLEAVARERKSNRVLGDRKQIEEVPANSSRAAFPSPVLAAQTLPAWGDGTSCKGPR